MKTGVEFGLWVFVIYGWFMVIFQFKLVIVRYAICAMFKRKPMYETAQHILKILELVILLPISRCEHVELDSAVVLNHP